MSDEERQKDIDACRNILGYTMYHYDKGYTDHYSLMDGAFDIVLPRGQGYDGGECATEADAWQLFPTGIKLVYLLELEIMRRDVAHGYMTALHRLVMGTDDTPLPRFLHFNEVWCMLQASEQERRDAAVTALQPKAP